MIETVPAYASAAVFYDVVTVRKAFSSFPTAFAAISNIVSQTLDSVEIKEYVRPSRHVEIPVRFGVESGPDLSNAASRTNLSETEFIEIFISKVYRVYMLGFLPGFPYMAAVDSRIRQPRHDKPRLGVPKGSVGIAGLQTGIYPCESPGGWQIIGRTDLEMFVPEKNEPATLKPGDEVKFVRES
jgi:inhibitor of KinA